MFHRRLISCLFICFFSFLPAFAADSESKKEKEDPAIHIFIHACTLSNWQDTLHRQLSRIHASGLYDACEDISVGVLGMEDVTPFLDAYPKIKILFQVPNLALYERPTLLAMHKKCLKAPQDNIFLYLHTKGVTRTSPTVTDWTKMMEYFVIDRWRDCVEALKDHDICGVNWRPFLPHFSGNFWWSTGNYLATLPHHIGKEYLDPEIWLGQNRPLFKCFHESHVEHYWQPYPEEKYILQSNYSDTPSSVGASDTSTPSSIGASDTPTSPSIGASDTPTPSSIGASDTSTPSSIGASDTPTPFSIGASEQKMRKIKPIKQKMRKIKPIKQKMKKIKSIKRTRRRMTMQLVLL